MTDLDRLCANCGLSFGSHRGDSIDTDACPGHEGQMDWPQGPGTHFADSGEKGYVPARTPARFAGKPLIPVLLTADELLLLRVRLTDRWIERTDWSPNVGGVAVNSRLDEKLHKAQRLLDSYPLAGRANRTPS